MVCGFLKRLSGHGGMFQPLGCFPPTPKNGNNWIELASLPKPAPLCWRQHHQSRPNWETSGFIYRPSLPSQPEQPTWQPSSGANLSSDFLPYWDVSHCWKHFRVSRPHKSLLLWEQVDSSMIHREVALFCLQKVRGRQELRSFQQQQWGKFVRGRRGPEPGACGWLTG